MGLLVKKITKETIATLYCLIPDVSHVIITEWQGNACSITLEEWTYQQLL